MIERLQELKGIGRETCFLWGPRQTGKSTLIRNLFPGAPVYDLLKSDEYFRLSTNPALLREEVLAASDESKLFIIDEVQKIPALLDEVHWLIENHSAQFVLCGSSARKLKRSGVNLLGGRALRYEMFPFVYRELKDFDLLKALNNGLLPRHYQAENPTPLLRAYIGDYLKEEIAQEGLTRNIPAFHRFLEAAAFSSGEILNYTNIARECGVSAVTVKEYFNILEDTLIGKYVPAYRQITKRRTIQAPKFYFFDVGIVNQLLNRQGISAKSEAFGKAFEQFIFQELRAYSHYSGKEFPITYWRSASGQEVDFILGDNELALEVKGTQVKRQHLKGVHTFTDEFPEAKALIVSLDDKPRKTGNITILPWKAFLDKLWAGKLL